MNFLECVIIFLELFKIHRVTATDINPDPKFNGPIANVTVPVGRDAILTCKVHDLISYKIAWLRVDTQTILTIQNHVITKNHRISISHTEHRIWQLKIKDVRESDRGWYMCQINTDPMKSQVGYLDVVVPPDILDYHTSHDIIVEEGQNTTLTCTATGLPPPTITWRREKEKPIQIIDNKMIYSVEGQNLTLYSINRNHMGAYLCIASNGVPPSVSKRVLLIVNFAPIIHTHYDNIYATIGQKLTLECTTESHPTSVNYWLKDKEFIQGGTYETVTSDNIFKIVMRLSIRPIKMRDFGEYKCVAKNAFGETHKSIFINYDKFSKVSSKESLSNSASENLYLTHTELSLESSVSSSSTKYMTTQNFYTVFIIIKILILCYFL